MSKVIIIGCGGVGTVCAHKCAQNPDVFNEIVIASRNRAKCDAVARAIGKDNISTDQVDADDVDQLVALLNRHKPDMVINLALPYQDLTIMEACLRCGVITWTPPTMSRATRHTLSTAGNGPTASALSRPG